MSKLQTLSRSSRRARERIVKRCISLSPRADPYTHLTPLVGGPKRGAKPVGAVIAAVKKFESSDIPLLASPQGGVAERSRNYREASADREAGVVFRLKGQGKPPRLRPLRTLRDIFLMGASTPPCGDARRGIRHAATFVHFIHSSDDRPKKMGS